MATPSTGQSLSNFEGCHNHHCSSSAANLTKLIDVELDLLIESFVEAKRRIDPVIAQVNDARNKFDQLQQRGGEITEMESELRELKQTTSKLKSKIPFNLIAPEYQPATDPNVINFQPPQNPTNKSPLAVVYDDVLSVDNNHPPPIPEDFNSYFCNSPYGPGVPGLHVLWCILAFPEGAFIKASLLSSFLDALSIGSGYSQAFELVSDGFINIKSVYKKHGSTRVYGLLMDPLLRPIINDRLSRLDFHKRPQTLVTSISGEEDIIYRGSADPSTMPSNLEFLHLGKWQWSPTHHIEMPDPNLYFKYSAAKLCGLKFISFRGFSSMKELPSFITNIRGLRILDLKACHHLEVIPSNIGDLWLSLTYLDMSECFFLDHAPASLSRLTRLRVLKGFFVAETNNEESCDLQDLSSMTHLKKLNIYTSLKTFPSEDHLTTLQRFKMLRNLTLCWGGCSTTNENHMLRPKKTPTIHLKRLATRVPDPAVGNKDFSFNLEKLDLRGAPEKGTRNWLRPSNFKKLEKLYIRGGQLSDLRHIKEAKKDNGLAAMKKNSWSVRRLRLRHLNKLQMDWSELQKFFPNLDRVEKLDCQNLTSFPCDNNGSWKRDTAQPLGTPLSRFT